MAQAGPPSTTTEATLDAPVFVPEAIQLPLELELLELELVELELPELLELLELLLELELLLDAPPWPPLHPAADSAMKAMEIDRLISARKSELSGIGFGAAFSFSCGARRGVSGCHWR